MSVYDTCSEVNDVCSLNEDLNEKEWSDYKSMLDNLEPVSDNEFLLVALANQVLDLKYGI